MFAFLFCEILVYARAYVTYTDADNNVVTVYSEVTQINYSVNV